VHWPLHRVWHVPAHNHARVDDGHFGRAAFWKRFGLGHQNTCALNLTPKCVQCRKNYLCHSEPHRGFPIVCESYEYWLALTWARKPMEHLRSLLGSVDTVPSTNFWVIPLTSSRASPDNTYLLPDLRRSQIRPRADASLNVFFYFGHKYFRHGSWSSHSLSLQYWPHY
jgi:hypothetical protein